MEKPKLPKKLPKFEISSNIISKTLMEHEIKCLWRIRAFQHAKVEFSKFDSMTPEFKSRVCIFCSDGPKSGLINLTEVQIWTSRPGQLISAAK